MHLCAKTPNQRPHSHPQHLCKYLCKYLTKYFMISETAAIDKGLIMNRRGHTLCSHKVHEAIGEKRKGLL